MFVTLIEICGVDSVRSTLSAVIPKVAVLMESEAPMPDRLSLLKFLLRMFSWFIQFFACAAVVLFSVTKVTSVPLK